MYSMLNVHSFMSMPFFQDTNGSSLSLENEVVEKNSCYCTHTNSSEERKRQETQDSSFLNSRVKRKPNFDGDRYSL